MTDITVPSTKCQCNLNLCKPNTCLNWTNSSVQKEFCLRQVLLYIVISLVLYDHLRQTQSLVLNYQLDFFSVDEKSTIPFIRFYTVIDSLLFSRTKQLCQKTNTFNHGIYFNFLRNLFVSICCIGGNIENLIKNLKIRDIVLLSFS